MTEIKKCFLDQDRPCDLTCKAAFEVDDPLDNVDCYFIWLAHHLGEIDRGDIAVLERPQRVGELGAECRKEVAPRRDRSAGRTYRRRGGLGHS